MGVCWSGNTDFDEKKSGFPYLLAAKMSARLWRRRTDHNVVVFVVHETKDMDNEGMLEYADELKGVGANVELVDAGDAKIILSYILLYYYIYYLILSAKSPISYGLIGSIRVDA
jgi:hypothetical protein